MFASLYFFSLLGLIMGIIGDLTYALVDPRIDFETREV
jgi:microcin C transport system permease protein